MGSEKSIKNTLKQFNKENLNILILQSNNEMLGLDLPLTTDIIQFDKIDEDLEKILFSRAYRLGRTEPLNVHKLLYDTEFIEENYHI